ncbi:MAG: pyruvate ferredoxin oxidoreductase [Prevotella sp.]|nr:pyruvate ferredoxin oxidoreductase [Prevotella sp.]MBO5157000.1 pyruvate ferredoxin oxidoreductase [Prevotella sp.]
MDYKYIEQLLERYWQCDTTLEEEEILRTFFNQKDVPAELAKYAPLFVYESANSKEDVLDDKFDDRIMAMIDESRPVKAKVVSLSVRMASLFKAAAVVAIVVTIGNAAQFSFDSGNNADTEMNVAKDYKKTYTTGDPSVAYEDIQPSVDTLLHNVKTTDKPLN